MTPGSLRWLGLSSRLRKTVMSSSLAELASRRQSAVLQASRDVLQDRSVGPASQEQLLAANLLRRWVSSTLSALSECRSFSAVKLQTRHDSVVTTECLHGPVAVAFSPVTARVCHLASCLAAV